MDKKETFVGMPDLASYMQLVIEQLKRDKKRPAVHTYTYALKSVTEFYGSKNTPMSVDEVFTPGKLKEYEEWMKLKGLSLNSVSTYMRTLKAVYNRLADERTLPYSPKLFADVYTKVESQTKRALNKEQMHTLLYADFEKLPKEAQCALAYFLLMFLFRGMPFIDLAYLRKQDVTGNSIKYSRHKTGCQITLRIPPEAVWLIEEFKNKNPDSVYLFPILDRQNGKKDTYSFYLQALRNFNKRMKKVATLLLPGVKLSSYTPRHTWATLAFHSGVNIGIISKALGHSSIKVTQTYLKPFENEKVDAANDELISSVMKDRKKKKKIV